MKRYGLISAIALIVITNVVVLAGVAYNRSGEPDAAVQLTERELSWQKRWGVIDKEDTGLSLKLEWSMPGYETYRWDSSPEKNWLNQEKLKELGFNTSFPLADKKAGRFYRRQLSRQAYVVLEFEGETYQGWLAEAQKRVEEIEKDLSEEKKPGKIKNLDNDIRRIQQNRITHTHLFAIDAGRDPAALRAHYSDKSKYIITPAVFDISRNYTDKPKDQPGAKAKPYLSGWIRNLSIPQVHVNSDYRSFFTMDIKTPTLRYHTLEIPLSDLEPRYQVTLNYGQRHEPWIAGVKKIK